MPRSDRTLALAAGLLLLAALLGGCSNQSPATGLTLRGDQVVVRYKPCRAGEQIDRITLTGSDDPDRVVWSARRVRGTGGATELAVAPRVPAYVVTDRLGPGGPKPGVVYSFDARSTSGADWGGPDLRRSKLEEGRVHLAGQDLDYVEWAVRPVSCPKVSTLGALGVGFGVAAVAGLLVLVVRRPLRALSRRAAGADPEGRVGPPED